MIYIVIGCGIALLFFWAYYFSPIIVFYRHLSTSLYARDETTRKQLPRIQAKGQPIYVLQNDRIAPFTWKAVPTGIVPYTLWIYPKVSMLFEESPDVVVYGGLTKFHVGTDTATGEVVIQIFNNKTYPVVLEEGMLLGTLRFDRAAGNISINF